IELAAAWVRMLSCAEIAQEIERNLDFLASSARNIPARHRSLRAAFEHSWHLLLPAEQRVLSKLSVFQGGFLREAAEQIAGASLTLLGSLMAKSLLRRPATGRYDLHELVRQYAAAHLDVAGLESDGLADQLAAQSATFSTQQAHATYYLALAEKVA